jgi:arginine/lysine/ornithine decarboxylase
MNWISGLNDQSLMQVWESSMIHWKDRQRTHEAMDNAPNILFTTTSSQQLILRILTTFQFRFLPAENDRFMTL